MINQPFNVFKDTLEIQVVPLLERTQGAWRLWCKLSLGEGCDLWRFLALYMGLFQNQPSNSVFFLQPVSTSVGDLGARVSFLGSKQWQKLTSSLETTLFLRPYSFWLQFYRCVLAQYVFHGKSWVYSLAVRQQHEKHHMKWIFCKSSHSHVESDSKIHQHVDTARS